MKIFLNLFIAALFSSSFLLHAQEDGILNLKESANVKVIRNDDGSRSVYLKDEKQKGMMRYTYTADGILTSVIIYVTGEWNHLTSCKVFDGQRKELYKVAYGYDQNARLVEEQMFDSREIDPKTGKNQLVRRFIYLYDEFGNRSKPICIVLVDDKGKKSKLINEATAEHDPFASERGKK